MKKYFIVPENAKCNNQIINASLKVSEARNIPPDQFVLDVYELLNIFYEASKNVKPVNKQITIPKEYGYRDMVYKFCVKYRLNGDNVDALLKQWFKDAMKTDFANRLSQN